KIAKLLGPEQNAKVYNTLFDENIALKKQLEDYHSQPNTLERRVKRLAKDVRSLKDELKDLDECVDREIVEIVMICKSFILPKHVGSQDRSISCILNSCLNLQKLDIAFSRRDIKNAKINDNDIDDEITEALAHTCHKLKYLDL
ncbi:17509_t:CDS:2, partial [Funneliformis geosporum]